MHDMPADSLSVREELQGFLHLDVFLPGEWFDIANVASVVVTFWRLER